jgi:dephospho-CoA kinase
MKFLILGYAQSGKDTFADYVVKEYSLKFKSASMLIAEKIIMPKFPGRYSSVEECYADRVNNRSVWAKLLEEYIQEDKAKFAREVFQDSEIYCGLRNPDELIAAKKENLFDLSIWIDRSMCFEDKASCLLTKHHADIIIENNGSLQDLYDKADGLFRLFDEFYLHSENYDFQ